MLNFAPAKVIKMIGKLLIVTLIIAIAIAFLCVKLIFRRNGRFASQHIHDSEAMRQRGIHCVLDQDREMRQSSRLAVSEK
jgi:branched-subunit amino acid permease